MNRRIALLVAAVLIAGLGTTLVFLYVKSADDRAIEAQAPVTVLVAKLPIAAGTRVQDAANAGSFEAQEFPAGSVTPGALSSVDALADAVAVTSIFPGQQILGPMFGTTATATAGSGLVLPPGQIAVSVEIAVPEQRVAGYVVPGSDIVVFMSGQIGDAPDVTRVLIPRATVLATGPPTAAPQTTPATDNVEAFTKVLFTLALNQADAEKIIFASDDGKGTLYFGLLGDASQTAPGAGVTAGNLFA